MNPNEKQAEEAQRLTMNQFVHDCGLEPSDELALKWFQTRCQYLQEQALRLTRENGELREAATGYRKQLIEWVEWAIKTLTEQGVDVSHLITALASLNKKGLLP